MNVQLPDGSVVAFPDGMQDAEINSAIDQHISSAQEQQGIVPAIKRGMGAANIGLNQYLNAGDQWAKENLPSGISDALLYEAGNGTPSNEELQRRKEIYENAAQDLQQKGEGTGWKGFVGETLGNPTSYTPGSGLVGQGLAYGTANALLGPKTEDNGIGGRIEQTANEAPISAALAKVTGSAVNKVLGPAKTNLGADDLRLIDMAKTEGLTLTPGQRTGNMMLRGADKLVSADSNQPEQFTKLVLAKAGIDSSSANPGVLDKAFKDVGAVIGETPKKYSAPINDELLTSLETYKGNNLLTDQETKKLAGYVENIYKGAGMDSIPGEHIQSMRSQIGDAQRAARKSNNTEYADALKTLRRTLDDAMDAQMSTGDMAAVKSARGQYASLKSIAAARKANNDNLITPNALATALSSQGREGFNRGFGSLNDLSQVGSAFVNPTQRLNKATKLGEVLSSAAGGYHFGGVPGAMIGAVTGGAAPYVGKAIYNNPHVSNYLVKGITSLSPEKQRLAAMLVSRAGNVGASVR